MPLTDKTTRAETVMAGWKAPLHLRSRRLCAMERQALTTSWANRLQWRRAPEPTRSYLP